MRRSLYRRCLKLALDWAVHRHTWRGQAVYIRSLFEANRDVRDPRQQKVAAIVLKTLMNYIYLIILDYRYCCGRRRSCWKLGNIQILTELPQLPEVSAYISTCY